MLTLGRELPAEIQIQQQDIYAWLAEEAEVAALRMSIDEGSDLVNGEPARSRDAIHLRNC